MKIPKSFRLMGHDFNVTVVPESQWVDDETGGYCIHDKQQILIRKFGSVQAQEQVFFHELVHAMLNKMGEHELDENEQFVDVMGSLLHQFYTSAK
jgi:hypothetical protein